MNTTRLSHTSANGVLDEAQLALHRQRRPGFLERIIAAYFEESPKYIKALKVGVAAKDYDKVKMAAHTLKSSSYNVGALRLSEICQQLETAVEQKEEERFLADMLDRVGGAYFEAEEALKAVLLELRKAPAG
jgi:HPt (histidine-containing phosphotransfer) domain-containing protein